MCSYFLSNFILIVTFYCLKVFFCFTLRLCPYCNRYFTCLLFMVMMRNDVVVCIFIYSYYIEKTAYSLSYVV